jgi:hypothetical protein
MVCITYHTLCTHACMLILRADEFGKLAAELGNAVYCTLRMQVFSTNKVKTHS